MALVVIESENHYDNVECNYLDRYIVDIHCVRIPVDSVL